MMSKNAKRKRDAISRAAQSKGYSAGPMVPGAYGQQSAVPLRLNYRVFLSSGESEATEAQHNVKLYQVQSLIIAAHAGDAVGRELNIDTSCSPIGGNSAPSVRSPAMKYTATKGSLPATRLRHKFTTRR